MNEENNLIYCSRCGNANPSTFKFCSNCGEKLEQKQEDILKQPQDTAPEQVQPEPPVFERADAEVVSEGKVPFTQDELNIHYGAEEKAERVSESAVYNVQYHPLPPVTEQSSQSAGGSIGFSIASMICGIISILCCFLAWFSLVLAIAAIILGVIALKYKYDGKGMAIAGIITGGIGIFIWLIVALAAFGEIFNIMDYYN